MTSYDENKLPRAATYKCLPRPRNSLTVLTWLSPSPCFSFSLVILGTVLEKPDLCTSFSTRFCVAQGKSLRLWYRKSAVVFKLRFYVATHSFPMDNKGAVLNVLLVLLIRRMPGILPLVLSNKYITPQQNNEEWILRLFISGCSSLSIPVWLWSCFLQLLYTAILQWKGTRRKSWHPLPIFAFKLYLGLYKSKENISSPKKNSWIYAHYGHHY